MQLSFETAGYQVEVAESLKEAIEIMKWRSFDVLLSDTNLAWEKWNTDWIEVAKEFRRKYPNWRIIWTTNNVVDNKQLWEWFCDKFIDKADVVRMLISWKVDDILKVDEKVS